MSILCVRIITGETIIGDWDDKVPSDSDVVKCTHPCAVVLRPSEQMGGTPMMTLVPLFMEAEGHAVYVERSSFVLTYDPVSEITERYKSIFSPIIMPEPQSIVTM